MQLKLGEKIRELRRRNGVTQEALADKLGITAQAVSRWEMSGSYPDMEMIPPIANFFGITIDELFGYDGEREAKIDEIIAQADDLCVMGKSQTDPTLEPSIDESLSILRQGLAEFPGNERLMCRLAGALKDAGYRRYGEVWDNDEDGYLCHVSRSNEYWSEAIKLYESLADDTHSMDVAISSTVSLVNLYSCTGNEEKARLRAERLPKIDDCREAWSAYAASGREKFEAYGQSILAHLQQFVDQVVNGMNSNLNLFDTDVPMETLKKLIDVFYIICTDGKLGRYHSYVSWLYLYLSRIQWGRGHRDEAFESLDLALEHINAFDDAFAEQDAHFTAPLIDGVKCGLPGERPEIPSRRWLPDDWPAWSLLDSDEVKREMSADPRWDAWVRKTQE